VRLQPRFLHHWLQTIAASCCGTIHQSEPQCCGMRFRSELSPESLQPVASSLFRGLDIAKIYKTPLIYSVSYLNFGGLGALFGETKTSERTFNRGYEDRHRAILFSWALVETCIACLYSNQNQRHAKIYEQIKCCTGSWLTLIILGLITEMFMHTLTFTGPRPPYIQSSGTMYLS